MLNQAQVIGRLGADPETRYTQSGGAVTNIRVATSERWKDKNSGEQQERTEWHSVVFFGRLAEIAAEYLKKGALVYIGGRLTTEKWQDKNGVDRYTTKIVGDDMKMLSGKGDGSGASAAAKADDAKAATGGFREPKPEEPAVFEDDDIPF